MVVAFDAMAVEFSCCATGPEDGAIDGMELGMRKDERNEDDQEGGGNQLSPKNARLAFFLLHHELRPSFGIKDSLFLLLLILDGLQVRGACVLQTFHHYIKLHHI